MKKTYIKPQVVELTFITEGVIAASPNLGVKDDINIENENEMLGNKYNSPWSSTNWEN